MANLESIDTAKDNPAKETLATQKFRAVHNVHATAGIVAPGERIALTREEFEGLKAAGAIEGEWKDK
jgi:hypothetical protein